MSVPPLKPLHPNSSLSPVKLAQMGRLATDVLERSLIPGQKHSLKTRPDGTILDGHHRIHVLRERGVDVDALPSRDRYANGFEACGRSSIGLTVPGMEDLQSLPVPEEEIGSKTRSRAGAELALIRCFHC